MVLHVFFSGSRENRAPGHRSPALQYRHSADDGLRQRAAEGAGRRPGEGTDSVNASVTYTLSDNVENLTLTGTSAINGTGNASDNVLTGNSGANSLTGGAGNDTYIWGKEMGTTATTFFLQSIDGFRTGPIKESLFFPSNYENVTNTVVYITLFFACQISVRLLQNNKLIRPYI